MHDTLTYATTRTAGKLHASIQGLRRWYRERRMISALRALSDFELKDIGVYRCAIPAIAHAQCAAPEGS